MTEVSENSNAPAAAWAKGVDDLPACKMPRETRKPRHNQWTRRKMVLFLRELAACQSVSQAARAVGMSRQSAHALRNRLSGTPFSLGWEMALEAGMHQLAHAMMDRAVNGEEVQHYYHGELVGTSRRYDNRLAIWLMQNPWKVGRQQVAREYVSEAFDRMLERIEWDSLDWQEGEPLPGRPLKVEEPAPGSEAEQSEDEDIAAEEEEAAREEAYKGHGNGEAAPLSRTELAQARRERRARRAASEDAYAFLGQRSWYGALAAEEGSRRRTPQGRWRGA